MVGWSYIKAFVGLRHPGAQGIGLRVRIYDKWNRMIIIEGLEIGSNCKNQLYSTSKSTFPS